jgi:hypothetical protein
MISWMIWEDTTPGDGEIDVTATFEGNGALVVACNLFPLNPWMPPLSNESLPVLSQGSPAAYRDF